MILVIDNYDSFTYNLVQRLGEIDNGLDVQIRRNDKIALEEIQAIRPDRIIISPGHALQAKQGSPYRSFSNLRVSAPSLESVWDTNPLVRPLGERSYALHC